MAASKIQQYLALAIGFLFLVVVSAQDSEVPQFEASCWNMAGFEGGKAPIADILALADAIKKRTECRLEKKDNNTYVMKEIGMVNNVGARLLWTPEKKNDGVYGASFACSTIASRIKRIAKTCEVFLETNYLSFLTLMDACDAVKGSVNTTSPSLPEGPSGIALDVGYGKRPLLDLKAQRAWLPFSRIKVANQEDSAPLPGWGIND